MKHLIATRRAAFALALLLFSAALLACGGGGSPTAPKTSPAAQPQAQATLVPATAKTQLPPAAADPQTRLGDSLNRLLLLDQQVLPSYHLEARGTEPEWVKDSEKIDSASFTFVADVSGDNVHFTQTTQGAKPTSSDSYIIGALKDGGAGYSVENGKVSEDLFAPLGWAMLPLDWGLPLIYASMGATARGEESVDGRSADKFEVDTAKAPAGAAGMLQGFGLNVYSSKGTAWVDKQTGALLKMSIDYERDVKDTSGKVAGKGSGHIELTVTNVGKVTVKLPASTESTAPTSAPATQVAQVQATATRPKATAVPSQKAATPTQAVADTPEPILTPTALPGPINAKAGQQVVVQGIALTLTHVELTDGPDEQKADDGNTFVLAYITIENVGNVDTSIDASGFVFLDKSGVIHDELYNRPSSWDAISPNVFDYYSLATGAKVQDQILLIQLDKKIIPGLKLRYTSDDDTQVIWDLGQ